MSSPDLTVGNGECLIFGTPVNNNIYYNPATGQFPILPFTTIYLNWNIAVASGVAEPAFGASLDGLIYEAVVYNGTPAHLSRSAVFQTGTNPVVMCIKNCSGSTVTLESCAPRGGISISAFPNQ